MWSGDGPLVREEVFSGVQVFPVPFWAPGSIFEVVVEMESELMCKVMILFLAS